MEYINQPVQSMNMRNGSGKERGRRYTVHKIIKIDREVEKIDIELQVRDSPTRFSTSIFQ